MRPTSSFLGLLTLLLALSFLALAGTSAWQLHRTAQAKVAEQRRANEDVRRLRADFERLAPVAEAWQRTFPGADQVRDIYALYQLFDFDAVGLKVNPDTLSVRTLERVTRQGTDLGLTRVCASTMGQPFVVATADSFDHLVEAATKLAARKDLNLTSVTLDWAQKTPRLLLADLCLLVRDTELAP